MREENVAIRLKGYIDDIGLTSSQFADQCGIPRPTLSQLLSGRNKKISDVLVGQIHSAFPDLSIMWLLFGEGDMLVRKEDPDGASLTDNTSESMDEDGERGVFSSQPDCKISLEGKKANRYNDGISDDLNLLLIEKEKKLEELNRELEQLKKNPRRVAQITVYYDDSTFETFYPGGSTYRGR
ncbi:MAG: hypothetical protein K2N05_07380 [Muribaculaceae bacterium]|nr:hypothetical protein [Muribaculaceae bacterium]